MFRKGLRAGRIATGERAGGRVRTGGSGGKEEDVASGPRCANAGGYSVHANVAVRVGDRKTLEALCQYAARPALSHDRLERWADGKLAYRMKRPWRDGTTHVVFDSGELLEKLAALVPRPRYHTIHFYGVLARHASRREAETPGR